MSEDQMSYGELNNQAVMTATGYLKSAIRIVNDEMGDDAALKYPAIVAAVMNAASSDYLAAMLSHRVRPGLDGVADAVQRAGDAIRAGLEE